MGKLRGALRSLLGVAVCSGAAALLSLFLKSGENIRFAAPAICLQAVIVTALFWGRLPGLIGGIAANLTFAIWLYPPLGSLAIHDPADRIMLILFQLSTLGVVVLAPGKRSFALKPGTPRTKRASRLPVDALRRLRDTK